MCIDRQNILPSETSWESLVFLATSGSPGVLSFQDLPFTHDSFLSTSLHNLKKNKTIVFLYFVIQHIEYHLLYFYFYVLILLLLLLFWNMSE